MRASGATLGVLTVLVLGASHAGAPADEPGRPSVLILTGQNNHDWARTSSMIREILDEPGLFEIETWEGPGPDGPAQPIEAPNFADFAVVVWDYNPGGGYQWPQDLRDAWVEYIRAGGHALLVHASNNPFPGWTEFEEMVGLLWRGADAGCALHYEDERPIRTPAGEGRGAGHGRLHDFAIRHREPEHPVLAGLPETWLHASDELYHWQRGPCPDSMRVLATAWDDPEQGGSGKSEPMLWQIPYGEGLVMTWLPGHLWRGQEDTRAYRCVGFQTIVRRAVEWLATGEVTQPVPPDFPTREGVSLSGASTLP